MIVLYIMSNGSPEENLKQIFRVFDINDDGTITLKELQKIVRDLFLLLNETNVVKGSQEILVKTGMCLQLYLVSRSTMGNSRRSKYFLS